MSKRYGKQTVMLSKPVGITATSSIVGPKEGQGPLGASFDMVEKDMMLGQKSWEAAESQLVKKAIDLCVKKSNKTISSFDYIIAGDLLNQNVGSVFGLLEAARPYLGIFGACSAMGEGLALGSMLIDGGFGDNILVAASSHFCTAEKQFRYPLEFGSQSPPTASWTVTGAGAAALSNSDEEVVVAGCTIGKMIDMGVKDASNMGAAMAGAAADTIMTHLQDKNLPPSHYDAIITGDLGYVGSDLLLQLLKKEGIDISQNHKDCGIEIFDKTTQDTKNGGSGCGCCATVFASHFYPQLQSGGLSRILFVPTGALMSPLSVQQGKSIPSIAHAVVIERRGI